MRILVTGASGFIGRAVLSQLARREGVSVAAASRSAPGRLPPGVEHHAFDLLASGGPAALVEAARPTHLLHLAWNAEPGRFWTAPDNLDWVAATLSLVRAFAAAGGRRAVLAGSCAEYDWTGTGLLAEDQAPRPATLYGVAKDATRCVVCAAGPVLGLSIAWGRVFWLYGPGEASGRLVSDVADALAAGRFADVSEGLQKRDFLHVDDVAGAFVAALSSSWNGPFNIGSGEAVAVRQVIELLGEAAGRPELARFGHRSSPPVEPPLLIADTRVLRQEIGFRPRIDLRQGLEQTYASWVRAHRESRNDA